MYFLNYLIIFAAVLWFPVSAEKEAPVPRIIGGEAASWEDEYRHIVSIRKNGDHICGGSILTDRFILTAAHCFLMLSEPATLESLSISFGSLGLTKQLWRWRVKNVNCAKLIHFPDDTYDNDIAILELEDPLPYDGSWRNIRIHPDLNIPQMSSTFMGWGYTTPKGGLVNEVVEHLQKLNLNILAEEDCDWYFRSKFQYLYSRSHVCASSPTGTTMSGDSGSPLVTDNGYQIGVLSGHDQKWTPERYQITFTKVAYYYYWIKDIIENGSNCEEMCSKCVIM